MENCTIYSHHLKFDEIAQIVKTSLPKAKVEVQDDGKQKGLIATLKGGFFGKTKQLKINYRERENPSCLLYTSPSPRDATLSRMPSSA